MGRCQANNNTRNSITTTLEIRYFNPPNINDRHSQHEPKKKNCNIKRPLFSRTTGRRQSLNIWAAIAATARGITTQYRHTTQRAMTIINKHTHTQYTHHNIHVHSRTSYSCRQQLIQAAEKICSLHSREENLPKGSHVDCRRNTHIPIDI